MLTLSAPARPADSPAGIASATALMGTSSNFGNMLSAAGASLFLSFLPMLPSQILLNNLLYDSSQRLHDLRRHALGVPLWPGAVPFWLVRRIAGYPDAGHLRDPHSPGAVFPQSSQLAAGPRRARRRRRRRCAAGHAAGAHPRLPGAACPAPRRAG